MIEEKRNLILVGSNGLGKTTIVKNLAYEAALAGRSVLFRLASELISDLSCDSPQLRKRKLRVYGRVDLLCIDEVGYLAYDANAADLLYEVVNRRYETGSIVMTTNRAFKEWNEVFPNAREHRDDARPAAASRRRGADRGTKFPAQRERSGNGGAEEQAMKRASNSKPEYVERALKLYLDLSETPARSSRLDRRLAEDLYEKGVELEEMEAAMLLASARRLLRSADAPKLGPIRSLSYFLPVIEEIRQRPLCGGLH